MPLSPVTRNGFGATLHEPVLLVRRDQEYMGHPDESRRFPAPETALCGAEGARRSDGTLERCCPLGRSPFLIGIHEEESECRERKS